MAFRTQRYKSIFWYAILMCAVYSLMAYVILNKLNVIKQDPVNSVVRSDPYLPELQPPSDVEQMRLSKLEAMEAEKSAQAKLELIITEEKALKKSEVHIDTSNTYNKPNFQSNSTHLWNMRFADKKYSDLAKQLTCRTVEYDIGLPSADKIDSCIESSANEFSMENTIEAQKWIFNHQNPSNCADKKYVVIKNIAWSSFATSMHLIAWAFAKALTLDRIAVYDTSANWIYGACESSNPDCVFLPISSCSNGKYVNESTAITIDANTNKFPDSIPLVFRRKTFIWYRSQILFYLLRYNRNTLTYVHRKISESFVPSSIEAHKPYISIYARHFENTKTKDSQKTYSLERYFSMLNSASTPSNITTVYINSEESSFIEDFKEFNSNQSDRYKLLTMTLDPSFPFNELAAKSEEERAKNILDSLTDIYVQVHGDLHVGTLTSKYCRLIDALRLTLGKTIPFYTPENRYYTHT